MKIPPDVIEEMAEAQLKMPNLKMFMLGGNSMTRDEYRERVRGNRPLVELTLGMHPVLRFKPAPK